MSRPPPTSTLFPYTTLFRSEGVIPNLRRRFEEGSWVVQEELDPYRALRECPACRGNRLRPESLAVRVKGKTVAEDRKSTRLNSSHSQISYAVFCLKKKKNLA